MFETARKKSKHDCFKQNLAPVKKYKGGVKSTQKKVPGGAQHFFCVPFFVYLLFHLVISIHGLLGFTFFGIFDVLSFWPKNRKSS